MKQKNYNYPFLEYEIKRKGIKKKTMAQVLGVDEGTKRAENVHSPWSRQFSFRKRGFRKRRSKCCFNIEKRCEP